MCFFFFFKQKTAYEMRISDWSSDVCSSDLAQGADDKCRNAEQKSEAEQRDVHLRQDGRQIAPVDGFEKNPRQQTATDRDLQQQKQEAAGHPCRGLSHGCSYVRLVNGCDASGDIPVSGCQYPTDRKHPVEHCRFTSKVGLSSAMPGWSAFNPAQGSTRSEE